MTAHSYSGLLCFDGHAGAARHAASCLVPCIAQMRALCFNDCNMPCLFVHRCSCRTVLAYTLKCAFVPVHVGMCRMQKWLWFWCLALFISTELVTSLVMAGPAQCIAIPWGIPPARLAAGLTCLTEVAVSLPGGLCLNVFAQCTCSVCRCCCCSRS